MVSHCDEFFASCLEFDAQGVLLVAGSSNGVVALFDSDEIFHRTINLAQRIAQRDALTVDEEGTQRIRQQARNEDVPSTLPAWPALEQPSIKPVHMIFTGLEVERIRWNPLREDEIACCFANRNEIYLYNLQKFPSRPHIVLKASTRPSSGYNDLVFFAPPDRSAVPKASLHGTKKGKSRTGAVIAGDLDGALRQWDLRFPTRPVWSVSTGSQPVNTLSLTSDNELLLCGTEGGMVLVRDCLMC
ncbi:hypothetical protein PINS_up009201 [Pythium insidiosum]|nr:hypothetical protein PINS_up009201 [Pythium insidiosum]